MRKRDSAEYLRQVRHQQLAAHSKARQAMTRLSLGQWGSSCLNPTSDSNINGNMISNGNCGGTVLQQGQSGQASTPTTVQNANPSIEVQRSTATAQLSLTSSRGNCTACFDPLNPLR
ncbi:MAG: hypothetical protein ACTHKP_09945 [Nitrososphaeraceae archaeon]